MAGVTFLESVGGDKSTVTDDANPNTGLDAGGHRTRFVPALAQIVAIASFIITKATGAANSAAAAASAAASALGAPGTNATSTTAMDIVDSGNINFVIQTGKLYIPGQTVVIASTASPVNQMAGVITAYNSANGSMTVAVSYKNGNGNFNAWNIGLASISGISGVSIGRKITGDGLASGGGDLSQDRTISVSASSAGQFKQNVNDKAVTPRTLFDASASVALQDGATITPDSANGFNFHVTLGGNRTLANFLNPIPGESGRIRVVQDATGGRTLAFGGAWKFAGGAPTLSTAAGTVDVIAYFVHDATNIEATLVKAFS